LLLPTSKLFVSIRITFIPTKGRPTHFIAFNIIKKLLLPTNKSFTSTPIMLMLIRVRGTPSIAWNATQKLLLPTNKPFTSTPIMLMLIRVRGTPSITWNATKKLLLPTNKPVNSAIEAKQYFNEEKWQDGRKRPSCHFSSSRLLFLVILFRHNLHDFMMSVL